MAQQVCGDFRIQIDATFNTNALQMALITVAGITDTGTTLPVAHCFIDTESAEDFRFLFLLHGRIDVGDSLPTAWSARGSGNGLLAASDRMLGCTFQLCEWHLAQNIK